MKQELRYVGSFLSLPSIYLSVYVSVYLYISIANVRGLREEKERTTQGNLFRLLLHGKATPDRSTGDRQVD